MRRGFLLIALLGLAACQPPKERIAERKRYAVEFDFRESLPGLSDADKAQLEAAYEAAVRAKLRALYGEPQPAPPAPEGCPIVKVQVDALELAAYPPKGGLLKGWIVDSTITGVLDHLTRNPEADANQNAIQNDYLDRYIARKVETHRLDRLGYLPILVKAQLTYWDSDRAYFCDLDGEEMLTAFHPLTQLGGQAPRDIRAEEARVLAETVAERLASRADWTMAVNR